MFWTKSSCQTGPIGTFKGPTAFQNAYQRAFLFRVTTFQDLRDRGGRRGTEARSPFHKHHGLPNSLRSPFSARKQALGLV